ncbi:MAG TPA: hypothetical protein VGE06_04185 [Flavisolibacter sp.]
MKKLTTLRLWISLLAVLMISPALAQPAKQAVLAALMPDNAVTSMTAPPLSITAKEKAAVSAVGVSAKVLRSFEQSFKEAQNAFWVTSGNTTFAEFKTGDQQAVVSFTKGGRITHTVLYGTEKHLPSYEKELIRYDYPGYVITSTQEVTIRHIKAWVALLQNHQELIRVRVLDGEIYELERFKKI